MDGDVIHNTVSCLHGDSVGDRSALTANCDTFLAPFKVIGDVGTAVDDMTEDVANALLVAKTRLKMYMGHVQRADNQDNRIAQKMEDIRLGEAESTVLTTIDYKMKFEYIGFWETSSDFYGKRDVLARERDILEDGESRARWMLAWNR